jgi:hypothetical protein
MKPVFTDDDSARSCLAGQKPLASVASRKYAHKALTHLRTESAVGNERGRARLNILWC